MDKDTMFAFSEARRVVEHVKEKLAELAAFGHKVKGDTSKLLSEFAKTEDEVFRLLKANETATGEELSKGLLKEDHLAKSAVNLSKQIREVLSAENRLFYEAREPRLKTARQAIRECDPIIAKAFSVLLDGLQKRWKAEHAHYDLAKKLHEIDENFAPPTLSVPFHHKPLNDLWGAFVDAYVGYFTEELKRREELNPNDIPEALR